MSSTFKTVAVSGATGRIGQAVVKALLEADFTVTVLTRPDSSPSFPDAVKVAKVDYDNAENLASALKGQDVVISTVGYAAMLGQEKLIDAAVAQGVKRIIPSEYGGNPDVARVRQLPVFAHKVQVEHYLKDKVQGTPTTYTLICNNEFLDWDLDFKFGVDIEGKKMEIFDGGDTPFTASPLDFVARGVVSVLQHPSETANRVVRLHGKTLTQNGLLEIIQRFVGKEGWNITHTNLGEREKQGYELLQKDPGNMYAWAVPFIQCACWGKDFSVDYSKANDNELLGLKELSDAEIEEIVRART